MLTVFGVLSASAMVIAYALENQSPMWIGVFAAACLSTAVYGVLTEAWIFAILEALWSMIAMQRFVSRRPKV
jgi:hypothetical protein